MASVPVETLMKEAGGTLAPTSTMQEATTLKSGLMTTTQVASLNKTAPVVPSVLALTASVTTLTPTGWVTEQNCTVAAGVAGVIKLASPGATAGYRVNLRVTFTPGSSGCSITVQNSNDAEICTMVCAFNRTRSYTFEWNGSAWESWQQSNCNPTNVLIGADGAYDFMLSETVIEEDFASIGALSGGLSYAVSGTGAAVTQGDIATMNGAAVLSTGTTTTGQARVVHSSFSAVRVGLGEITYGCALAVPVLSDGTDSFSVATGIYDSATGLSKIAFIYTHSTNSGAITYTAGNAGTSTSATSGVTLVAGTVYRLAFVVNSAGTAIRFYVNGVLVGTITSASYIPTSSVQLGCRTVIVKSAGTTSRDLQLDKIKVRWSNRSLTIAG